MWVMFVVSCRFDLPPGGLSADAPLDGASAGCPAIYKPMTGGTPGHVYLRATTAKFWEGQENSCGVHSPRSHIAVPDDATELTSLHTLVDSIGGPWPMFWIGINDRGAEGVYVRPDGVRAAFLPWATGQPDNIGGGDGEDCIAATTTTVSDEGCLKQLPAICECEP